MNFNDIAISDIKAKNIYFWGGGKVLDDFTPKYFSVLANLNCHIKGIVDKDKVGEKLIGSNRIPLITPDTFFKYVEKNDFLIITTVHYKEIIEEIKAKENNCNINVGIYYQLINREYEKQRDLILVPDTLATTCKQVIPKVIHYCWFGGNPLPDDYKKWMESWKKYCPDYEIIEWNESNYDIHKIKYIEQAYSAKKWAFVSDYVRLDVIFEHGGIYLDTDVELLKSIDELLCNEAFCGFENKEYINFGLGYGAKKKNSIIKEIMSIYEKKCFIRDNGEYDMTRCPQIQTEIMEKHGLQRDGAFQLVDSFTVLPEIVLCPMSYRTRKITENIDKAFMIHHFAGSWIKEG